jgi:3-hydroxy-D-aspartate aldolase
MDADYARDLDQDGEFIHEFGHSLFLLSSIMSRPTETRAICDAGLKVQSLDSGLPTIFGRTDIEYLKCSDEHGVIHDPSNALKINEKLRLVPGHCDPTCNIHDWYVGVRNGKVEVLWPVSARGKTL